MLQEYIFIGLFLLIGVIFPAAPLILGRFIRPKKPNHLKSETYECGIETVGDAWVQFKAQYYIFALVFVIFDVETIFLFPWAVAFDQLALFMVFEMVIFILILAAGLIYAWRKGALEWM
jgi:NADH:ubiquinone oxidoreductase subunit 3 (subunit A)